MSVAGTRIGIRPCGWCRPFWPVSGN